MEWWFICAVHIVLLSACSSVPQCQHYLSRRKEGVFHYDRHMRYQLNYHNAQVACIQDFGGKIATRDQLEKALKSGLEECRAGWISSAEVAYPRINNHWNCGENKTGIISYGFRQNLHEKWDVFCYKEDDDCSPYDRAFFKVSWDTTEPSSKNVSPTPNPFTQKFSLISDPSPTSSTLLLTNAVPKREDIETSLPIEGKPSNARKINDSDGQEDNSFLRHFPLGNFSEHNKSFKIQVMSYITVIEPNTTSEAHKNGTNGIGRTISLVSNLPKNTYVPESVHSKLTNPYLPTSDNRSHVDSTANSFIPRLDYVENSILHETGSNMNSYEMKVRKEKFDILPLSPIATRTANPVFYERTVQSKSTFITREPIITNAHLSITSIPENDTYFPDRNQTKTDMHRTDFFANSQHEGTTQGNQFHIHSSQSHSGTMQTMVGNTLSQEKENPVTSTPFTLLFLLMPPSDFSFGELVKDVQTSSNGQKAENEVTVHRISKNSSGLTDQYKPTKNPTNVLHLATDQITSQQRRLLDVYPTSSSHLRYLEKEVQAFVDNNVLSEATPTSNLENGTNIDGKRDNERVTVGNQKAFNDILTLKEPSTSPASPTAKMSTEEEIIKYSTNIASTSSSFFTPYDHMKVTASPTSHTDVTTLSLDSCGGRLKALSGQFISPGFPQSYEKNMNCMWVIEVPLDYYVILDFVSLVIEEHRYCEYDYVMIYDGMKSDQHVLGRFCGLRLPSQIRSSSNVMTVIMRSDSSVELDGISVQFRATQTLSGVSLTEGKNSLEGVVEIEYQGVRGNICAKQWTKNHAQVVCQQLGFSGPAIATRFRKDESVQWAISYVSCNGSESALENCSLKTTGLCDTQERAGVICQVYESCANLKNAGVMESGSYTIDPDGADQGESHFRVECDMASDSTTGITIVGHDSEGKERVTPCQTPGCYSRVITYKAASLAQLRTLTSISENCEQFVKLDCRHVRFLDGNWGWWVSRDGQQIISWGGAATNSGRCACGENGKCAFGITSCNCDINDDMWRMDEGAISDKSSLPILEFRFGGTSDIPMAMAFHRLGKLKCWGTISVPPVLESCAALKEAGITDSGRYIIDPDGVDKGVPQFEVFCDMSSFSGITVIGHNSERRIPVSPCEEAGCYKRELIYSAAISQINALTTVSQSCEQFVRLDCRHLRFIQSGWGWWVSWDGKRMDYWGGADPSIGGCACGTTGTCSSPDKLCNCDSNDNIWRTDDGFLRDKTALPVLAVYFGDTNDFPLEMAYHTIGKLRCRGRGTLNS
ncbi:uncharacterized protein LOC143782323 [Ranitomeya variabilis]|uniref:uncharacterized protein LOC143782323 n=1 Tax=Ranitomeya variabilis TaxID=490064 RepID=UPI004056CD26